MMLQHLKYLIIFIIFQACSPTESLDQQLDEQQRLNTPRPEIMVVHDSKGDLTQEVDPELTFWGDFTETLTAELHPSDILTVRYDPKRLSQKIGQCEQVNEGEEWESFQTIVGWYQTDDQEPQSFEYIPTYTTSHQLPSTKILIPEGQRIAFWFESIDPNGCQALDDNFGVRYVVTLVASDHPKPVETTSTPTIYFDAQGNTTVEIPQDESLQAKSTVIIRYDLDRLRACESYQNQFPQWGVTGHFKTDLSEEEQFVVTETVEGELISRDVTLNIPEGETLSIWFTATNRYGCFQEDEGASFELIQ